MLADFQFTIRSLTYSLGNLQ